MIGNNAIPSVYRICFVLTLPINISNKLVPKIRMAVDKFAGAISMQMMPTGTMIGKNPFLKSLITFCLRLNCLLMYINSASLARSDVWKVMLMTGNFIHLLPAFNCTPNNNVYNNRGIEIKNNTNATRE